jgi:pyridoxamine 5'-phosphate oxidase
MNAESNRPMPDPTDPATTLVDRRTSYERDALDEAQTAPEPFAQFGAWLDAALAASLKEPNAMTLATADAAGRPTARIVLLRGWDERGFVFFTNYDSRKGRELAANPHASLLFFWDVLERQVRIDGDIERLSAAESDAYFARRPRGHRLSAWASPQSTVVPDRASLEAAMADADARFGDDVPRPPYWGGYRVIPAAIEFWQGRRNRVHDRIAYRRADDGWVRERLAP